MREFFLTLGQIRIQPGQREWNIAKAIETIDRARRLTGGDIVLLPEALPLGWTHPGARNQAEPIPDGEWCRALSDAARRNKMWVCSGVVERAGDRVFNSAVLINADGEVVLTHRKINELDIAHEFVRARRLAERGGYDVRTYRRDDLRGRVRQRAGDQPRTLFHGR